MDESKSDDHLTADEFSAVYTALSVADFERIRRVSVLWAGTEEAAQDLRQEAIFRALDGKRRCPRNVDVVRFLNLAMKSIAWSERQEAARRPTVELELVGDQSGDPVAGNEGIDVQDQVTEGRGCAAIRCSILALFDDDPIARTVAEGIMEGLEGEELCELAEISKDELATKRKLFRRRVSAAFPQGWRYD